MLTNPALRKNLLNTETLSEYRNFVLLAKNLHKSHAQEFKELERKVTIKFYYLSNQNYFTSSISVESVVQLSASRRAWEEATNLPFKESSLTRVCMLAAVLCSTLNNNMHKRVSHLLCYRTFFFFFYQRK